MSRDLSGVETPSQFELCRDIADHEVFITFLNDDDAMKFRDWLDAEGWLAFAEWGGKG